jgi:DNA-binding response OmpR family regulator
VILDLMLPDGSGFDVLKAVRAFSQAPLIILTAKDAEQDKILGLELGADDYMVKPFSPGELMARARAVQRRVGVPGDPGNGAQVLGGVELLPAERAVRVDGQPVELTPREFELLHYLLINRGLALTRERLLEEVWGYSSFGDARTVDVHVGQLRKKLGPWGRVIQTVWGLGYKADPGAV